MAWCLKRWPQKTDSINRVTPRPLVDSWGYIVTMGRLICSLRRWSYNDSSHRDGSRGAEPAQEGERLLVCGRSSSGATSATLALNAAYCSSVKGLPPEQGCFLISRVPCGEQKTKWHTVSIANDPIVLDVRVDMPLRLGVDAKLPHLCALP